ncbi:MAG: OmpA family protein [Clostridia bacterium]|nr:OmpA family protein [Clostridia bacterium]
MARQHVHNRRAGRGGGGSYWISYSDIMAALVLVFVLFLVFNLYQYNLLIEQKAEEQRQLQIQLDTQQTQLDEYNGILIIQQGRLDEQEALLATRTEELAALQLDLDAKKTEYDQQTIILIGAQQDLEDARATLAARETEIAAMQLRLDQQEEEFRNQAARIDSLVGLRTRIIQSLSVELRANNINATVDPTTGDIILESAIFFDTNKYEIKKSGQRMLNTFLPVYLSVLLSDEYRDYVGEIIIEGHTDSSGSDKPDGYISNLKLSQNRALAVTEYCLSIVPDSQKYMLQQILTAKGRSYNDLVYKQTASGEWVEDKAASRRVEFKFSLKDAEMIAEMNRILTENNDN